MILDYRNAIIQTFGKEILKHSALLRDAKDLEALFLDGYDYDGGTVVEIGACQGLTACYFAHHAPRVVAFDLHERERVHRVWRHFGVDDRIDLRLVPDEHATADVSGLEFSFAFIDAQHTFDGVSKDFFAVHRCGTVLFHDVGKKHVTEPGHPQVRGFVLALDPSLSGEICDNETSYWYERAKVWLEGAGIPRGSVTRRGCFGLWRAVE